MTVDKRISYDYVEQDGVNNYIKNSKSVTVPKEFKARKNAPATKLAYITADEAKMLKKKKPGTPHKGPKGIPSYDSFDAQGNFTSGAAMSAMESGSTNARDRAEVQASNYGAPSGAGPGVKTQAEQDLRSSIIAAGAGQRVNPGFFDSRNVVSPAELARARAFNPAAFSAGRRGGIMDLFTGGGFLGNIVRGLGQKFGLGKRFDQPTYDMSRFSGLPLGGSAAFQNLDIRDKFDRRKTDPDALEEDTEISTESVFVPSKNPVGGLDQLAREIELLEATRPGTTTIDTLPGSLRDFYVNKQGLSPTREVEIIPDDINFNDGIMTIPMDTPQDQSMDDFYKNAMASSDVAPQFQNLVMRTTGGLQDPVTTKLNEQKDKIEAIQKSDAYEYLSDAQKEQLQKDLNKIIQDLNLKQIASSVASSIDT